MRQVGIIVVEREFHHCRQFNKALCKLAEVQSGYQVGRLEQLAAGGGGCILIGLF